MDNFQENNRSRLVLDGVELPKFSEADSKSLEEVFSVEETKEVVWSCNGNKSHGPRGPGGRKANSIWWRDLSSLCTDEVALSDPFVDNLVCSLDNGSDMSFWCFKWLVKVPLKEVFPLFVREREELYLLLQNCSPNAEAKDNYLWGLSSASSGIEESLLNLFHNCVFVVNVWRGVERWVGFELLLDVDCIDSFLNFDISFKMEVGDNVDLAMWTTNV
ncbi:hypothetical protein KIW84_012770 [Lathyrus oleraceus]|uniref:Uncharacterized protein n=1 Tax=Pisum sativum TaxID=3888 RepID=A0A9D5BIF0_PEA|nr:hypothetical protein KIW84_012770 [Pisum sativum]